MSMLRTIALIAAALSSTQLSAQYTRFHKSFGGTSQDEGRSVKQTFDKGYIISGATSSFGSGNMDVFLIKTDSVGMQEWTMTYGGSNSEWGYSVVQLADSGYAIGGYTNSSGNGGYDMYLIRTDKNGAALWSKTYGGAGWDLAYGMQHTTDGGFVLAGTTYSYGAGNADVYIVKTDAAGDTLWTKTFGGAENDEARSVWQNADGGFFINGFTSSLGNGQTDIYYLRTDAAGTLAWSKTLGGALEEESYSGRQTFDGGFVFVGYTNSFTNGVDEAYMVKTDASGDTLWSRRNGQPYEARAYAVTEGVYYQLSWAGRLYDELSHDIYFFKTGPSGDFHASTTHGYYPGDDAAYSIELASDQGLVIVGSTESYGFGLSDVYLVKTDNNGSTSAFNSTGEMSTASSILVSPNPFSTDARVTMPSGLSAAGFTFHLCDVTGREVRSMSFNNGEASFMLDRAGLDAGIYFYTVCTMEGKRAAGKLIVQ